MKVIIGNDHAGVELKNALVKHLTGIGYDVTDIGVASGEKCHYPEKAKELCERIISGEFERGILVCGTGIGMSMSANKFPGIRAAATSDYFGAKYTRLHNDANVLCLGQRIIGEGAACELAQVFMETEFDTENPRHKIRVDMMNEFDNLKYEEK